MRELNVNINITLVSPILETARIDLKHCYLSPLFNDGVIFDRLLTDLRESVQKNSVGVVDVAITQREVNLSHEFVCNTALEVGTFEKILRPILNKHLNHPVCETLNLNFHCENHFGNPKVSPVVHMSFGEFIKLARISIDEDYKTIRLIVQKDLTELMFPHFHRLCNIICKQLVAFNYGYGKGRDYTHSPHLKEARWQLMKRIAIDDAKAFFVEIYKCAFQAAEQGGYANTTHNRKRRLSM